MDAGKNKKGKYSAFFDVLKHYLIVDKKKGRLLIINVLQSGTDSRATSNITRIETMAFPA